MLALLMGCIVDPGRSTSSSGVCFGVRCVYVLCNLKQLEGGKELPTYQSALAQSL